MDTRIQTIDILKDFHKITGARISLHDLDYNEIAAYPQNVSEFCKAVQRKPNVLNKCHSADTAAFLRVAKTNQAYTYKCHCGLIETVAPIFNYGTLTGYIMMGQICSDDPQTFDNIIKLSKPYFESLEETKSICKKIPVIKSQMIESYVNLLEILAEYMTQTNRLTAKDRDLAESVKNYINKFYQKKLSIKFFCETFGCSRTTLMNTFREKYGITVNNYITNYRLAKAEKMLSKSDCSIKTVALDCGFSDQNYFVKVFRQKNNCTPTGYRKRMTL